MRHSGGKVLDKRLVTIYDARSRGDVAIFSLNGDSEPDEALDIGLLPLEVAKGVVGLANIRLKE